MFQRFIAAMFFSATEGKFLWPSEHSALVAEFISWARHNGHESAIRIFLQFLCFYRAEKTQKTLFMLPFRVSCSLRQAQRMECSLTLERQLERGKKKIEERTNADESH